MDVNKIFEIAKQFIGNEVIQKGKRSEEEIARLVVNLIHENAGSGPSHETVAVEPMNMSMQGKHV